MHRSGSVDGGDFEESSSRENMHVLNSIADDRIWKEFLIYFGRAFVIFYPVYLTGYLGVSITWVLLCTIMILWWKKNRQRKDVRIGSAIELVDNEARMINKELNKSLNMATWVHFPDFEKADWLNKVLLQAWPFFGMFMEKLLKENIQQSIRLSSPALKTFTFTKVHFGHIPLKITGVKAYTDEVDKREVILDMNISYCGDVDIDADVKPAITVGVKGLQLKGMLRVILDPLIGQAPLVGGVTLFFIRRPTLQINWTGLTNVLDTPAFSQLSEGTIMDLIASLMVLPNRLCIPLIDQVKVDQMRFPLPRGVVRVYLLEARDLLAKDTYMMGMVKGKSDPYAVLGVGNTQFKSKTIKENLHPRWNEVYEFVVHEAPGQELEVELFDEDTDKDDFLGRYNLDLGEVKKEKEIAKWFPLEGIQHGEIHLKIQWLSLQTDHSLLKETTDGCACAMLAVYLDNASNLPKDQSEISQKHGKPSQEERLTRRTTNPNSFVEFSIDEQVQKSKVAYASKDPVWEEGFTFFVHSVNNQQLNVQVKEHGKKTLLGSISLPLSRLLNTSNMALEQRFPLERSGTNSQIKMKATLRILHVEKPEPKLSLNPPPQPKATTPTPQTNRGSNTSSNLASLSPPISPATPSYTPTARVSPPAPTSPSTDGFTGEYETRRPTSSFLAATTPPMSPSNLTACFQGDVLHGDPCPQQTNLSSGTNTVLSTRAIMNHQGSFGEIQVTLRYATMRKKLIVLVDSCRNLFPCNENGCDAYVRLYLLPDQSLRHRRRTQVKQNTVNPVYSQKFEFDVSLEEAATRKLDVAVKNNRMFHSRERKEVGMVLIDLVQLDLVKGSTEWYELALPGLKKPARG